MKAKIIVSAVMFVAGFVLLTSGAFADDVKAKTVTVSINQEDDRDANVDLNINGKAYTFNLPEMAEGETRDITTDSGEVITLKKNGDGISISLNGEDILIQPTADHELHFGHGYKKANVFAFVGMDKLHNDDEILISASGLDDDAKTRIKNAIEAAGINKKVIFSDENSNLQWINKDDGNMDIEVIKGDGDHKVIKLKKRIELHQDKK